MDGSIPNGRLTCRRVIVGMFDHRWLVERGGGKSFLCPIPVEEGRRLRRRFAIDGCKLGKNRPGEALLLVALGRRDTDKTGQPIGPPAVVVGSVVDLTQRPALAERLAGQARFPPERFFVEGTEFRLTRHPCTDFQHRLGQMMRQVRGKENGGGGKARRQSEDDLAGPEPGPRFFLQFADTDYGTWEFFFYPADRVIASDGVFRNRFPESCDQCHHSAGKSPGSGFRGVTADGLDDAIGPLKTTHPSFKLTISLEAHGLNEVRHFRVNRGPIPGGAEIGEKPMMFMT